MKKSIKTFISLFAVCCCMTGCNFLDTQLYNNAKVEQFYDSQEKLQQALDGVYSTLNSSALYGDNMLGRLGLAADLGYEFYKKDRNTVSYYMTSVADAKIDSYWKTLYQGINRANLLLTMAEKKYESGELKISKAEYNDILGQAKFLRALFYYMLEKRFVNIPLVTKVIEDSSTDEKFVEQAPPYDVYAFIIRELEEASEMVKKTNADSQGWRVYNTTCYAMIARAALNMAGYPVQHTEGYGICATYAKKVIDSGMHELNPDFNQIFINYAQSIFDIKESIFEVNFWGDNSGIYQTAGCVGRNDGMASGENSAVGYCMGLQHAHQYLWEIYKKGNEADGTDKVDADVRCIRTINRYHIEPDKIPMPESSSKGREGTIESYSFARRYAAKFRREEDGLPAYAARNTVYTDMNFPVIRYADVLLMYAEAYAYDPSCADRTLALECINKVKRRAHAGQPDPALYDFRGTSDALKDEIKDERARELAFEYLRKDDLCRWNILYSQMKMVLDKYNEGVASQYKKAFYDSYASVKPRDEVWPIPSREMNVNTKLKQNPGW